MKVLLSKASLLGAAAMLTATAANAQHHSNMGSKQIVHRVNRTMSAGSVINLQRAFANKLRAGQKIQSIRIVGNSRSYNSKVMLKKYSQILDSTSLKGYASNQQMMVPMHSGLSGLKLVIKGSVSIQRIVAQVSSAYNGGGGYGGGYDDGYGDDYDQDMGGMGQVLKARVNQHTYGITKIPVKRLVQQQSGVMLSGSKVKAIVIKAKATSSGWSSQSATVQVMVNNRPVGQVKHLSSYMGKMVIKLSPYQRNIIGEDISSIKLKVRGNALVKMVGLKVEQSMQDDGYGDGYDDGIDGPQVVSVNVQKALFGSQRVVLQQLIGYNSNVNPNKTIVKLELVVSGQGSVQLAGAGYGRAQRGSQNTGRQTGKIVFDLNDGATSVKDIALLTEGNLTIKKVKITFDY